MDFIQTGDSVMIQVFWTISTKLGHPEQVPRNSTRGAEQEELDGFMGYTCATWCEKGGIQLLLEQRFHPTQPFLEQRVKFFLLSRWPHGEKIPAVHKRAQASEETHRRTLGAHWLLVYACRGTNDGLVCRCAIASFSESPFQSPI